MFDTILNKASIHGNITVGHREGRGTGTPGEEIAVGAGIVLHVDDITDIIGIGRQLYLDCIAELSLVGVVGDVASRLINNIDSDSTIVTTLFRN